MNKKYIFLAALAGAAFTSCSDDLGIENKGVIKNVGDEILFSGKAAYEIKGDIPEESEDKTRTIYTGGTYTDENNNVFEPVEWISGDKVRIYCDNAHGAKYADYQVTEDDTVVDEDKMNQYQHATGLIALNDGLKWGAATSQHTFYAVYPSPVQHSNGETTDNFFTEGDDNNTLVGYIPYFQDHKGITTIAGGVDNSDVTVNNPATDYVSPNDGSLSKTLHVVQPNMDYAYMVAKTVVPNPSALGENDYVSLDFIPIATAVEITLRHVAWKSGSTIEPFQLLNVQLSSVNGEQIFGGFTANLNNLTMVNNKATSIPGIELNNEVNGGTSVSLSMRQADGSPTVLQYGDAVKFTAFLLPHVDVNNINVTIGGIEGQHTGKITGIKIEKNKKTYLKQVPITGDVLPFTLANWMRWVDGDVKVRELSIPGAGGAASYNLATNGTTNLTVGDETYTIAHNMVRQQTASIEEQWNRGVRCFEFSVDVNGTDPASSLGASPVLCSGISTGKTLAESVQEIRTMLNKYPHECAMAIITYETSGGWSGASRDPKLFMNQLDVYWNAVSAVKETNSTHSITVQTALYDPTTTNMADARGKLYCIARPTSIHQDYGDDVIDVTGYDYPKGADVNDEDDDNNTTEIVVPNANKNIAANNCILTTAPASYANMSLPTINSHVMIIHGWGPLKDKWQQRGYTNYSIRSDYGSAHGNAWVFMGADGATTIAGETTAEPYRPFDGSQLHTTSHSHGWGSATGTLTPITSAGTTVEQYKFYVKPTTSNVTVNSVKINEEAATNDSDGSWYYDFGDTYTTSDIEVEVQYTYNASWSSNSQTTETSYKFTSVDLSISKLVTLTLERTGSYYDGYSVSPSWGTLSDYASSSSSSSTNASSYYGNIPSITKNAIDLTNHTADFSYPVVSGSTTSDAWVQEWARVSNSDKIYQMTNQVCREGTTTCSPCNVVNWGQSYAEKLKNIKDAMTLAVNRKTNGKADYTFINSLCGYYITENYAPSVFPCALTDCGYSINTYPLNSWGPEMWLLSSASTIAGMGGDISGYASDVNKAMYEYMTTDPAYNEGALGIIIMDRVNETTYGKAIASMIVGTNFLFEIEHDTAAASETDDGNLNSGGTSDTGQMARPRGTADTNSTGYKVQWY